MSMHPTIRPIAIGIFRRMDHILVGFAHDLVANERYCRPPGGGIEFGERAVDALRRELQEEVHAELGETRLLGVLENTFELEGAPKHEIIFVFESTFADPRVYEMTELPLYEAGWEGALRWVSLAECRSGAVALYPDGVLALVDGAR
jgi:ADP-ribose pyrophosphatase YjhB (NUDIX family)